MEIIYIDESGDNGVRHGSSPLYIISGLSIESCQWKQLNLGFIKIKQDIVKDIGTNIEELKGEHIFQHTGDFYNVKLSKGYLKDIYLRIITLLFSNNVKFFVLIKSKEKFLKEKKLDTHTPNKKIIEKLNIEFLEYCWNTYLDSYEEYLINKSLQTGIQQNGLIYYDKNHEKYVRRIVRNFSRKTNATNQIPFSGIIEDPIFVNSKSSFMIQLADIIAYTYSKIYKGKSPKDLFHIDDNHKREFKNRNIIHNPL
ncbi:MAG: DUF3800 domain-containing protein [Candidatus Magnetoovum sp. WYHC-5]|nr:DUF3800 domain-containing protein [Candidatus Magnetoovum sp. WYHC-5]